MITLQADLTLARVAHVQLTCTHIWILNVSMSTLCILYHYNAIPGIYSVHMQFSVQEQELDSIQFEAWSNTDRGCTSPLSMIEQHESDKATA